MDEVAIAIPYQVRHYIFFFSLLLLLNFFNDDDANDDDANDDGDTNFVVSTHIMYCPFRYYTVYFSDSIQFNSNEKSRTQK